MTGLLMQGHPMRDLIDPWDRLGDQEKSEWR